MTKIEQDAFYVGASLYLGLDSNEVDDALAKAGLDVNTNTSKECTEVIKIAYPTRYEFGKRLGPGDRMMG
jgi:hypothetical protein